MMKARIADDGSWRHVVRPRKFAEALPADFVGSLAEIEGDDGETECPHGIAPAPDQLHGGQHDAEKSRI